MVLVARKAEGLAKPAEAIKAPSSSTKVFTTTADFKDEVSVASLFQRAESVVGKVSVVINAARAMNKDLGQERSNPLNGGAIWYVLPPSKRISNVKPSLMLEPYCRLY